MFKQLEKFVKHIYDINFSDSATIKLPLMEHFKVFVINEDNYVKRITLTIMDIKNNIILSQIKLTAYQEADNYIHIDMNYGKEPYKIENILHIVNYFDNALQPSQQTA